MTVKQYRKAVDIARRYGSAKLKTGCTLYYHGAHEWSINDKDGQTIDTASSPSAFEYLFD